MGRHRVTPTNLLEAIEDLLADINKSVAEGRVADYASTRLLLRTIAAAPEGSAHTAVMPLCVTVNKNRLTAQLPSFIETLGSVDVSRIRFCKACDDLFYARNSLKETCSRVCGTLLRVRASRQRQKEQTVAID